jgi:hypothetical protein
MASYVPFYYAIFFFFLKCSHFGNRNLVIPKEDKEMSEKEKKEFYLAMCKCCLLAEAMKTCQACRFKIGLLEREKQEQLVRETYCHISVINSAP